MTRLTPSVNALPHPIQPLVEVDGVLRFKANAIVRHLLDTHPSCDMNALASLDFRNEDRVQFAQLIGYSLGGYGELTSYVSDEAYEAAQQMANGLDQRDAIIAALEIKLAKLHAARDDLRESMARLLENLSED